MHDNYSGRCFNLIRPEQGAARSICSLFRYRSYSGRCNNLVSSEQGAARSVQQRILPPDYDNSATSSPRTRGVSGANLPNPRYIIHVLGVIYLDLFNVNTCFIMFYFAHSTILLAIVWSSKPESLNGSKHFNIIK